MLPSKIQTLSQLSIQELAALVGRAQEPCLPQSDFEKPELSWAQERLWFMNQLTPNNPFYNLPFCFAITGPLNTEALRESLNCIIARHEPLRSVFPNGPLIKQRIRSHLEIHIPYTDLSHKTAQEREEVIQHTVQHEVSEPFDLATGPLLRAQLLRTSSDTHYFIYSFHHIVFDGWSTDIFFQELIHHYGTYTGEKKPPLPKVERYSDFALWQSQTLSKEAHTHRIHFLKKRLSNREALHLPTDYTRPSVQSFRGKTVFSHLDSETRKKIEKCAQELSATPFMVMLAAFQIAMGRYGGMEDFLMGSPVAGRVHPATHNMIGFFLNNLILRGDISGDPSFLTVIERVRNDVLEATEHQNYSFQNLVQEIGGVRDLSRNAIYQVSFCYQSPPLTQHHMGPLTWQPIPLEQNTTHMDLEVMAWPDSQGMCFCTLFATDLFREETIKRFHEAFNHVLIAGLETPDRPISTLPLAAPQSIKEWAHIRGDTPAPQQDLWTTIHGHSVKRPNDIVLIEENGEEISWHNLMHDVERYAAMIATLCPGPLPIAIRLHPSKEYIVSILASLRLTRPWIPLDPRRPIEAIAEMLEDAKPGCLITASTLWPDDALWPGPTVNVDGSFPYVSATPPYETPHDQTCVFIQFTSGSSGRPKAVEISYGGLMNRMPWALSTAPLSSEDRGCLKTSPAFVDAACELLDSLMVGMSLVIPSPDTARSPYDLADLIHRMGVTRLVLTPSFADVMFRNPKKDFRTLKTLILGGENVSKDLATHLLKTLSPDAHIINYYGATELTSDAAYHRITSDDLLENYPFIPIGRPLPGTEIWLLDEKDQPVPPGMIGHMHAAGAHLALGYRYNPEMTAAAYRLWETPDGHTIHLYATGDMATRRSDGLLICLGRRDRQIKIRGIRIEAGEVETRLRAHPAAAEAVLLLHEKEGEMPRLVAHVLKQPGTSVETSEIRTYLGRFFSPSILPEFIMVHEAWPMTATGKVDRSKLPLSITSETSRSPAIPTTMLQEILQSLWQEALKRQNVGVHDSFFDSGGNSLLLAQLHQQILERVPYKFPLTDLFQYPTIAALADHLGKSNTTNRETTSAQERAQARRQALQRRHAKTISL